MYLCLMSSPSLGGNTDTGVGVCCTLSLQIFSLPQTHFNLGANWLAQLGRGVLFPCSPLPGSSSITFSLSTMEPLGLLSGSYLLASKIILQREQEPSPLWVPSRAGLQAVHIRLNLEWMVGDQTSMAETNLQPEIWTIIIQIKPLPAGQPT